MLLCFTPAHYISSPGSSPYHPLSHSLPTSYFLLIHSRPTNYTSGLSVLRKHVLFLSTTGLNILAGFNSFQKEVREGENSRGKKWGRSGA